MVESRSLQLALAAGALRDQIAEYVAAALSRQGFDDTSAAMLQFLSALDCGVNFGSDIARRIGVSRQMVAKTVRSLCAADILERRDGPGRQKEILFTARGEQLMSAARQVLADLDSNIAAEADDAQLTESINCLNRISAFVQTA